MQPHACLSSTPAGVGKSASPIGAGLALIAGIFIACTLPARGDDVTVQEEPLPSSTDYTVPSSTDYSMAETNAAPAPPSLPYPAAAYGSKEGVPGGEAVASGEPRRFHYRFGLTVRGVYDDNINISHTPGLYAELFHFCRPF